MTSKLLHQLADKNILADLLAFYETYYQTALGYMISFSCGFDTGYSVKKVRELGMKIDLSSSVLAILQAAEQSDSSEQMKSVLRDHAVQNALSDLLEQDQELLNKQVFSDFMHESIGGGYFYNDYIQNIFSESYPIRIELWKTELTSKTVQAVQEAAEKGGPFTPESVTALALETPHRYSYLHRAEKPTRF